LPSWAESFKSAGIIVAYSIVWWIVGGYLALNGILRLVKAALEKAFGAEPSGSSFAILLILVGIVIIALGSYASIFKVITDHIEK